jgi:hypothetical protein
MEISRRLLALKDSPSFGCCNDGWHFLSVLFGAKRHLERGLSDQNREFFHGDRRVAVFRTTGRFYSGAPYDAPHFEAPTLRVSTLNGYAPEIERIMDFTGGMPDKTAGGDA